MNDPLRNCGTDGAGTTSSDREATVAEGVEHLQRAANELIEAARTFLDVVEDVVADRERLQAATAGFVELLGGAADAFGGLLRQPARGAEGESAQGPTRNVRRIDVVDD